MKKLSISLLVCAILSGLVACNNEKLCSEAKMLYGFRVKASSGTMLSAVIGDDNVVTVKVSPRLDEKVELNGARAYFYVSRGATVTPDPSEPQNFALPGGVKYTVTSEDGKNKTEYTVTWGISDPLPYGSGFAFGESGAAKTYIEFGYPGEMGNWDIESILYGDLIMYHAYCGDYIVLVSLAYIAANPSSPHCIKIVDKLSLENAGINLNLGSINISNIKMVTSDYKGRMVAAVVTGGNTEFFYWTAPTEAPRSAGKINLNMAPFDNVPNNFQVAGDITGNAWITAIANPRGPDGNHYRVKVTDGVLASTYSTVSTGYSSGDGNGFQMISPLDDSDNPSFVVGDTRDGDINGSIRGYIINQLGMTTGVMPPHWNNGLPTWPYWVQTGQRLARMGGRNPVVSALPINGKTYIAFTSGSVWWPSMAVLSADLQTLAHENLSLTPGPINFNWSFGYWVDWYYDEDASEAYLSIWIGRWGLFTFRMTCFE